MIPPLSPKKPLVIPDAHKLRSGQVRLKGEILSSIAGMTNCCMFGEKIPPFSRNDSLSWE